MPKKSSVNVDSWYDEYEIEGEEDYLEQDQVEDGFADAECQDSGSMLELGAYMRPGRLPSQDQDQEMFLASEEASLQSTPLAPCGKGLDDLEDWEVCSPVVDDGPTDASGEWHAVVVDGDLPRATNDAGPDSSVRKPAKYTKHQRKHGADPEKAAAEAAQLKASALAAAQEASREKKAAKLKQLKDQFDVVLPHSANMKEIDRMLKIMYRQKVKKEVSVGRENQKMKKQADIRGNRQRSKSWDVDFGAEE